MTVSGQIGIPQCRLPLSVPPEVVSIGVGRHGVVRDRDVYTLSDLWALHLYDYSATLVVRDLSPSPVELPLKPGVVTLTPPGVETEYRYKGPSEHLFAHFRLRDGRGARHPVPIWQQPGTDVPVLRDLMTSALTHSSSDPTRTTADLWAALLRVAEAGRGEDAGVDPAAGYLAAAIAFIDRNLALPITVPEVAAAAGISHTHLTRLFVQRTGDTVVAHLRRRRAERARHLLTETTLSITAVAAAVGVPDLQALNKLCRAAFGRSPRQIRGEPGSGSPPSGV